MIKKSFLPIFILISSFANAQSYCPELTSFLRERDLLLEDDRIQISSELKLSKFEKYSETFSYIKKLAAGRTSLGAFTFLKNTGSEAKALDAKVAEYANRHAELFNDLKREEGQLKTLKRTFTGLQDGKELTEVQKAILQDADDELQVAKRKYSRVDKAYQSAKESRKLISRKFIQNSIKTSNKPMVEAGKHAGKYLGKSFKKNKWFYISLLVLGASSLAEHFTDQEVQEFKNTLKYENNPLLVLTANTHKDRIHVCDLINTNKDFKNKVLKLTSLMSKTSTDLQAGISPVKTLGKAEDALSRDNMKGDISSQSKDDAVEITVYKN